MHGVRQSLNSEDFLLTLSRILLHQQAEITTHCHRHERVRSRQEWLRAPLSKGFVDEPGRHDGRHRAHGASVSRQSRFEAVDVHESLVIAPPTH